MSGLRRIDAIVSNVRAVLCTACAAFSLLAAAPVWAQGAPLGVREAEREGRLIIYAATDRAIAAPLIADFRARHPGIALEYHDLDSAELYRRVLAEGQAGRGPDVVWSSAMDLQMKLVNDGHAQPHVSPETRALPRWANWKDEAFGTSLEPVAIVYNRRLLAPDAVPDSHAALLRLLADPPEAWRGRIATYDPGRSGLGFLLHSQDSMANPVLFWRLAEAFGRSGTQTYARTADMLDRIAAGDALLGYNLLGSYAQLRASQDPNLGVVFPRDYTLVMSRVTFIARYARHPHAARLWIDHLLSQRSQRTLAARPGFYSVRRDVAADELAAALQHELGSAFRPIPLGTGLLTYLDQHKRRDFLLRWNATIAPLP